MFGRIKVVIVDCHPLFVSGVRDALVADGGFEVVGEIYNGTEVVTAVARLQPHVLLLALRTQGIGGFAILDRVRRQYPDVKIAVVDDEAPQAQVESAFARGASAYLLRSLPVADLAPAIRHAVEGTAYHAYGLLPADDETVFHSAGLSPREAEILRLAARGLSNKQIAKELYISIATVKFHLTNIFRTLGISNRTEAALWALDHGIRDADGLSPVGSR
jgi:DNA-binding NarL/FixJ family response regulator